MRIRWSPAAVDDLEQIGNYLREKNPAMAQPTALKLYDAAQSLKKFTHRGRVGRVADTRELIIGPLPYIIVYQVVGQVVHIVRIIHAAKDWP